MINDAVIQVTLKSDILKKNIFTEKNLTGFTYYDNDTTSKSFLFRDVTKRLLRKKFKRSCYLTEIR